MSNSIKKTGYSGKQANSLCYYHDRDIGFGPFRHYGQGSKFLAGNQCISPLPDSVYYVGALCYSGSRK